MKLAETALDQCVDALKSGRVIVYPTEAVWGLGCDPNLSRAVHELLRLKKRPVSKGLILASGQIAHFGFLLEALDGTILSKMKASWPGHVTWLVPHHGKIPEYIHGDSDKVAIRVSAHPVINALSDAFGGPIVSTSANPAGEPAAKNLDQAQHYFSETNVVFAPGETGGNEHASRIIDAISGEILRD